MVHKGEPEARGGARRQRDVQQPLVAGQDFQLHMSEHDARVGNHRGEGDVVDARGQQFRGLVPFEFQRQLEIRLDEAIREARRNRRHVFLQRGRNGLPLGRLERRGQIVHAHLQAPGRFQGHEAALRVHVRRLHTAQHRLARQVGDGRLIFDLQQILADDAALQFDFPRL